MVPAALCPEAPPWVALISNQYHRAWWSRQGSKPSGLQRQHLGRMYRLRLQGRRGREARNHQYAGETFGLWRWKWYVLPKLLCTSTELHARILHSHHCHSLESSPWEQRFPRETTLSAWHSQAKGQVCITPASHNSPAACFRVWNSNSGICHGSLRCPSNIWSYHFGAHRLPLGRSQPRFSFPNILISVPSFCSTTYSSSLRMEAGAFSETLITLYYIIRRHIPEDSNL
jgi:hypothetical protein